MRIFITKNGQQLGPYTLEQVQSQVRAGTLEATDWAWYEGLADWAPINHIPGFSTAPLPGYTPSAAGLRPPAAHRRPILVWVISIFYFVTVPFSLLYLAIIIPLTLSGTIPVGEAGRNYFASLNAFDYGMIVLTDVLYLAGAGFLFLLKRPALYCFVITFLLGILNILYQIIFKNWLAVIDANSFTLIVSVITLAFCYLFYIAVLGYVAYLYINKTLR